MESLPESTLPNKLLFGFGGSFIILLFLIKDIRMTELPHCTVHNRMFLYPLQLWLPYDPARLRTTGTVSIFKESACDECISIARRCMRTLYPKLYMPKMHPVPAAVDWKRKICIHQFTNRNSVNVDYRSIVRHRHGISPHHYSVGISPTKDLPAK